jgi:adenylate kinase family enzyme
MSEKASSKQPQKPIQIYSLLGPPGSGKETQCNLLAQRLQLEHLNIGDLLRKELDREGSVHGDVIKQNMTAGTAGSSEIITAVLQARVGDSINRGIEAVVLDGMSETSKVDCDLLHSLLTAAR